MSTQNAETPSADSESLGSEPREAEPVAHEAMIVEHEQTVEIERSVRYGRIIVGAAVLGGLIAALGCVFFPIAEESNFTMGLIMGFMAVIGAAIGLVIGALLSLILALTVRRRRGRGVAIQADIREPQ